MRLTCPNCDAQYEVDDNAVPETGRDVQCSNCGHAWFQLPADLEDELPPEVRAGPRPHEADEAVIDTPAPAAAQPGPEDASEAAPEEGHDEAPAEGPLPPRVAPRRSIDDGLKRLLREEADREHAARKADGGGVETQPDLGLDAGAASSAPVRQGTGGNAIKPGKDIPDPEMAPDPEEPALAAGARRDLLPDIEEINSTLRANSERGPDEPGASADAETPTERKRGFRRGFGTILLAAVVLALFYLYAPKITQQVPAAAGPLNAYVQTVDKGRIWLNDMMQRATHSLTGGKSGNGA